MFRIKFELSIGKDAKMIDIKKTAAAFGEVKQQQHVKYAHDLAVLSALDEGFTRLRKDIDSALAEQVDALNHEPEVGNILGVAKDDDETRVSRSDLRTELIVKYDAHLHTARLTVSKPYKFDYTIVVVPNGTGSWLEYKDHKKEQQGVPNQDVSWFVDRALCALLGIAPS
jgi:hypothetical protein